MSGSANPVDTIAQVSENYPLQGIFDAIATYNPAFDKKLTEKAYWCALEAHDGVIRKSGEPYFSHVYAVALNLAELKMDTATIAAGLLHDVVEDTDLTSADIESKFGGDIRHLVDGVTKIGQYKYRDKEGQNAENFRSLVLASAKDIRVIIIKLADRLHNMRTLEFHRPEKQERIARETLNIFAPFANRLGMSHLKTELEELSFQYCEPDAFEYIRTRSLKTRDEQQKLLDDVIEKLNAELKDSGIEGKITGRPKSFFSIHQKMVSKSLTFDEIFDIMAVRVLVDSIKDCYSVLGIIHTLWRPVVARFKDYIASPKPNLYQSLHTTVMGPESHPLEVQIRTHEMHRVAEEGVAAHWVYKEGSRGASVDQKVKKAFDFLRQFQDLNEDVPDVKQFFHESISNILSDSVFVLTPRGEARSLPKGSTIIDFAYDIHTELGNTCAGGRVNGKFVQLRYELRHGDTVEVVAHKNQTPRADWLKYVKTFKARSKISQFIKEQEREYHIQIGKDMLNKELEAYNTDLATAVKKPGWKEVLQKFSSHETDDVLALLGGGNIKRGKVLSRMESFKVIEAPAEAEPERTVLDDGTEITGKAPADAERVHDDAIMVGGLSDVLTRFAKCCLPVYGDKIIGVVTTGQGISVHNATCANVRRKRGDGSERVVNVSWDPNKKRRQYMSRIQVIANNRMGLAADINATISNSNTNMTSSKMEALRDNIARGEFTIFVEDLDHLERVMEMLKKVNGVSDVQRR